MPGGAADTLFITWHIRVRLIRPVRCVQNSEEDFYADHPF
jgi:hypothetical protein